ncbi:MAG: hypothetical protein WCG44_00220 [bacterium]
MKQLFLIISIVFGFVSPIIGVSSVLKGNFRPQRMTRFLIFLVSLLFVGTLYAQGDRNSIYMASAQLLGSALLFYLSIKRGMGGNTRSDWIVFLMAIASLVVWQTTNNPLLGLIMSIVTDFIGFVPTLIKTWKHPETEEWKFYMSDVVASFFSILSISALSLSNSVFPIYILAINIVSVVMILGRKRYLAE